MSCSGKVQVAFSGGVDVIRLSGDVRLNVCPALAEYLQQILLRPNFSNLVIDLTHAHGIDSTALGQLAKISIECQERFHFFPSIVSPDASITHLLMSMGFDKVFHILHEPFASEAEFEDWVSATMSESEARAQVISAHRVLMSLNDKNNDEFRELVDSLESQQSE